MDPWMCFMAIPLDVRVRDYVEGRPHPLRGYREDENDRKEDDDEHRQAQRNRSRRVEHSSHRGGPIRVRILAPP